MSRIGSKDTQGEVFIRKSLFKLGFRYRLHRKDLPGKPDIVLKKHRAVILINGCFWHGHDCHLFKWPATRTDFWSAKIEGNIARDRKNIENLAKQGWRVMIIWECALKGKCKIDFPDLITIAEEWLLGDENFAEVKGFKTENF